MSDYTILIPIILVTAFVGGTYGLVMLVFAVIDRMPEPAEPTAEEIEEAAAENLAQWEEQFRYDEELDTYVGSDGNAPFPTL